MEQWVGILLGFIVAVAIIVAYMYRRSNFDVAPLSVSDQAQVASLNPVEMSTLPLSSMTPQPAPSATMAPQAATTTMMASSGMEQPAPSTTMAPQAATTTMMASGMEQPAPSTTMAPQAATTDDIEPAYDAKFAEYTPEDDIKVM